MDGHEKSTAGHTAGMEVFICIPGMARFQRIASSADHIFQPLECSKSVIGIILAFS